MAKYTRCSQCKYLKDDTEWNGYSCEADLTKMIINLELMFPQNCYLYRSRTLTAWQEVRQDAWKKISPVGIVKSVINLFK